MSSGKRGGYSEKFESISEAQRAALISYAAKSRLRSFSDATPPASNIDLLAPELKPVLDWSISNYAEIKKQKNPADNRTIEKIKADLIGELNKFSQEEFEEFISLVTIKYEEYSADQKRRQEFQSIRSAFPRPVSRNESDAVSTLAGGGIAWTPLESGSPSSEKVQTCGLQIRTNSSYMSPPGTGENTPTSGARTNGTISSLSSGDYEDQYVI